MACLNHMLAGAGNASLMTPGLRQTLCDHAAGNYRILITLAGELLTVAARRDLAVLDESCTWTCSRTPIPSRSVAPRKGDIMNRQPSLVIHLPPMSDRSVIEIHR